MVLMQVNRYLVVDLMTGGDLRFHISRKTFTEEAVRFWIAELACALRYVHQQGIIHRDVKPDNVLLDAEGHVHLTDFNVASEFKRDRPLTSKSGTLVYLAPEVYRGKGYLSEVDWWSLGVTFYECIYNKRPFEAKDPDVLAQSIVKADPKYPTTSPPIRNVCLHAISSLLEKDRTLRIGAAGFQTFTDNPFFREIDFDALERKEIEPIFCPSSEKTNFDATYDLEELLLEEAPLEARSRKQKPRAELRGDATQQEIRADELHRMIETLFEPFNYTLLPEARAPIEQSAAPRPSTAQNRGEDLQRPLPPQPPAKMRSAPSPRAEGAGGATRMPTNSPDGSPPLPTAILSGTEYFPPAAGSSSANLAPMPKPRTIKYNDVQASAGPTSAPYSSYQRPSGPTRSTSRESTEGSMGKPADSPTDEQFKRGEKPSGMLAFLGRKKGRDKSPKARERGVLGKEGARVVVKDG